MHQGNSASRRWSAWVATIGLVALVTACQFDPYTLSYAKVKPDLKEIVGSWVATDDTLQQLSRTPYSKARPTISVTADGSIQMADIPDAWRDSSGAGKGSLEAFMGTWKLDKHQDSWWGLAIQHGEWSCYGCLMILGQRSPYRLIIRVGDPDQGIGYEFRKAG
jgi:hypothetical protein